MYIILPDKIVNYLLYDKLETSLMSISIFMHIKIFKCFFINLIYKYLFFILILNIVCEGRVR